MFGSYAGKPDRYAPSTPEVKPTHDLGFWEGVDVAARHSFMSDHTMAPFATEIEAKAERDKLVYEAAEKGRYSPELLARAKKGAIGLVGLNTDLLAREGKRLGLEGLEEIKTNEDIRAETAERFSDLNEEYVEASGRARTFGGKAGLIGGVLLNAISDPIYLPTYFYGAGQVAKAGQLGRQMIKAAAKIAPIEMGAEAARQAVLYDWKEGIGADHSLDYAVKSVLMAGGISAGLGAVTVAAGRVTLRGLVKKAHKAANATGTKVGKKLDPLKEQVDEMGDMADALGDEADKMSYLDAEKKIEAHAQAINNPKPEPLDDLDVLDADPEVVKAVDDEFKVITTRDPQAMVNTGKLGADEQVDIVRATDQMAKLRDEKQWLEQVKDCV